MKARIATIIGVLALAGCGPGPKCIKGHYETVHHEAWTQMIPMFGPKGMVTGWIPVYHPAYDSQEFKCDEYEAESPECCEGGEKQ